MNLKRKNMAKTAFFVQKRPQISRCSQMSANFVGGKKSFNNNVPKFKTK